MSSYHMGFGFYGSYFLTIALVLVSVLIIVSHKRTNKSNIFLINMLDKLKDKYATGEISKDEFDIRKSVLDDLNYSNPYLLFLYERYINSEIDTQYFYELKKIIENKSTNSKLIAKLSKGELSLEEYKLNLGGKNYEK